jgi:hypothetical protein
MKKEKIRSSIIISILAALSFTIFFVDFWINTSLIDKTSSAFASPLFGFYTVNVMLIFPLGLSFMKVAIYYDKE